MDFIDNAVLPQSLHHLELIRYLLILTFILFIPYLAMLVGSLILSLWLDDKAKREENSSLSLLSKKCIDFISGNRTIPLALGVVPLVSALFGYAQLLQGVSAVILEGFFLSILTFSFGVFLFYKYKTFLHLRDILKVNDNITTGDNYLIDEAKHLQLESAQNYRKYGIYSLVFLLLTGLFFTGATSISLELKNLSEYSNIFYLFLHGSSLINMFFFILFSLAIGSASFLFFNWKEKDESVKTTFSAISKTGLVSTLSALFVVIIGIFTIPGEAMNSSSFILMLSVVIISLVIVNLFYLMLKEEKYSYSKPVFYFFFILITLVIIKDNYFLGTVSQDKFRVMAEKYTVHQEELMASMGVGGVEISGIDIYNGRCLACHQFDQNLVGPSYNSVLPKYEGKPDDLVKFILNPQKIDPNYPAMPGQGLKPKEARAVADYIISIYQQQNQ